MKYKTILSKRNYKAGYVVIKGIVDGSAWEMDDYEMNHAETPDGHYIGPSKFAYRLCKTWGIKPELMTPTSNVCSIGFCEKDQKWFGWSHRAMFGFDIGAVAEQGDIVTQSGWTDEYLALHPEADDRLPVGYTATNLDEAKTMAIAFASSVS
jgi:hypothetical protein